MPRTLRKNNNKKVPAKIRRSKRRFGKTFRNRKQNGGFCFIPLTEYGLKRNSTDQETMNKYLSGKQAKCDNFNTVYYKFLDDPTYDAKIKLLMENWPSKPPRKMVEPTTQVTLPPSTHPAPLPPPPTRQHIPPPTPPRGNPVEEMEAEIIIKNRSIYFEFLVSDKDAGNFYLYKHRFVPNDTILYMKEIINNEKGNIDVIYMTVKKINDNEFFELDDNYNIKGNIRNFSEFENRFNNKTRYSTIKWNLMKFEKTDPNEYDWVKYYKHHSNYTLYGKGYYVHNLDPNYNDKSKSAFHKLLIETQRNFDFKKREFGGNILGVGKLAELISEFGKMLILSTDKMFMSERSWYPDRISADNTHGIPYFNVKNDVFNIDL